MTTKRKIIRIDEDKCTGCGLCVPSCAEGALQIVDGKARLVSDVYCDGLGACLGDCPEGALIIEERDALAFDEAVAMAHVANQKSAEQSKPVDGCRPSSGGCPGSLVRTFEPKSDEMETVCDGSSKLANWPVQLDLVPPQAPWLQGADILLTADCVPFAMGDFHSRLLKGRPVIVGCPKLDDAEAYVAKVQSIIEEAAPKSVTVVHMEVPCCSGLVWILREAMNRSSVSLNEAIDITISLQGAVLKEVGL